MVGTCGIEIVETLPYFARPDTDDGVLAGLKVDASAENFRCDGALLEGITTACDAFKNNKAEEVTTFGTWTESWTGKDHLQMREYLYVGGEDIAV